MRSTLVSLGFAAAIVVAGCGGSSHKSATKTSTATKTTHSTTSTAPKKIVPKPIALGELITVAKSGKPASATASAGAGVGVQFLTRVPGTPTSRPVNVHLDLSQQGATKWTVTASVKGQKSTATLTSKDGKPLKLGSIRYSCSLPPGNTFCPASHIHVSSTHIGAQFSASPATPIVLATVADPPPTPAVTTPAPTSAVAPTYGILTSLVAVPKHPSKSAARPKPGTTVAVHPGDFVLIRVNVTGKIIGAPQPATLTFGQGPSKSITVTAGVPGGAPSTSTITSATGHPIEVVLPRYSCVLPPAPTFCPFSKIGAASHKYTLAFGAVPRVPVSIQAVVQGG